MFKHYLLAAFRNFHRHWVTTTVNVVGLTVGLACFIGTLSVVKYYELDDSQYPGSERTYFVMTEYGAMGSSGQSVKNAGAPWVAAEYLKALLQSGDVVARMTFDEQKSVVIAGNAVDVWTNYADANFLKIFPIPFAFGDATTALTQPHTAIITEAVAQRLFGRRDAVGKTILLYGKEPLTIVGITEPPPQPSSFGYHFEMLISMDVLRTTLEKTDSAEKVERSMQSWKNSSGSLAPLTYVRLSAEGASNLTSLNKTLTSLSESHDFVAHRKVVAYPIAERRSRNLSRRVQGIGLSWSSFLLMSGGVILFASCLNYANLTSAVFLSRRKELLVRRVIGAHARQLILQSLIESAILILCAYILSLLLLVAVNPGMRSAYDIDLIYGWLHSVDVLLFSIATIVLICVAVTIYPTLVLKSLRVAPTLHQGSSYVSRASAARLLVAMQFLIASVLLTGMFVMRSQHAEMRRYALSALPDSIVTIDNNLATAGVGFKELQSELLKKTAITSVSGSSIGPYEGYGLIPIRKSPEASATEFSVMALSTTQNYFTTMHTAVLAGESFTTVADAKNPGSKDVQVIIDQSTAKRLGWDSPNDAIGKIIYPGSTLREARANNLLLHVIGVVEDKPMQFSASGADTTIYFHSEAETLVPLIRLQNNRLAEGLASIDSVWRQFAPGQVLHRTFLDERVEKSVQELSAYVELIGWIASLAFAIAASGLIGISVHMANQRKHEIGVRKTLGARTTQVTMMLLRDFSKPVIVGNIIAWPIAYVVIRAYLRQYIHQVGFSLLPFLLGLTITLLIAGVAVTWQAVRAARTSPATVLRHE